MEEAYEYLYWILMLYLYVQSQQNPITYELEKYPEYPTTYFTEDKPFKTYTEGSNPCDII